MSDVGLFFLGVGAATALTSLLALLIVVAEALIADYGQVKITVNEEKELDVEGGRPLLSTLKAEEIFIPSACGGRGSCGLCKLTIASGAGEVLPTELPWLDEAERAARVRLACQVKVKRPLAITIPEELFNVRQYATQVAAIRDLAHNIKEVVLELVEPPEIDFRAGQFIQLEVPPYELTDEPIYRAYSIASSPSDRKRIELEIKYVPDGISTTYVHKYLRVGDHLTINGPYGEFGVRESDREMIFVAGGSGMAPIKSILLEMAEKRVARRARYFFGANTVSCLFMVEEMRDLEERLPDFKFLPAVAEPEAGEQWGGERGLVTDVLERSISDASGCEAYLCGAPMMIEACIELLKRKGLPEERIYFDKFT